MRTDARFNASRPCQWIFPAVLLLLYQSLAAAAESQPTQPQRDGATPEAGAAASETEASGNEASLLKNIRQLTFEGRRAGEGYFSADGSQLVFQSEREPGNPFFQIYLMDRESGDVSRVSPGHGKTTCARIHPDGDQVLFASTHEDKDSVKKQREELESRQAGKERRYSWDYDEHYELYALDPETRGLQRLTATPGYDAEGSWSPDGKLIAFTSNRRAYEGEMTPADKRQFEVDPAFMNDIFIMDADGNNVRQLTTEPGYDGGPFFSPDGKRICWRHFAPNGATAEIWTMNVDGTDKRQITHLGVMSWAPFYHPSGEYLIFTTNRHGFDNFELYLIEVDGKSQPVRVTHTKGFDGLPAFTPEGKQLAWTSNRTGNKQSQLFLAEWDHSEARKLLGLKTDADNAKERLTESENGDDVQKSAQIAEDSKAFAAMTLERNSPEYNADDIARHVKYLCRDELEGRFTGSPGEKMATAYVAAYMELLGLQPAGDDGSWFQEFEFTSGVSLGPDNEFIADGKSYVVDEDWRPLSFSGTGEFKKAPLVFAGYGIVAEATNQQEAYDSYVHLDVKDKWVLVFRYLPENISPEKRQQLSRPSQLRFKTTFARDRGARGLIVVTGDAESRSELVPLRMDGILAGSSLPVISVTNKVAESWLEGSGKSLEQLQKELDDGTQKMGFEIKDIEP